MNNTVLSVVLVCGAIGVVGLGVIFFSPAAATEQAEAQGVQDIPRMPDGKPDFSGIWAGPAFAQTDGPVERTRFNPLGEEGMPSFTSGGEALFYPPKTGDPRIDDPPSVCMPLGLTRQFFTPHAQQWIQGRNQLGIVYEVQHSFRPIPLDGRAHPENPEKTWMGHSVGRWEGDTLVIDTVGLKAWNLDGVHYEDENKRGRWHSDQLHVVERVRHISPTVLSYEITFEDPVIFTEPWAREFTLKLKPTWELYEYECAENNRCAAGNCVDFDQTLQTTN